MPIRVLLVDDNADVRMLLRLDIDLRSGFEVVGEAADGLEALQLAAELAPDIIVLDREMPVAGGLEVLTRLREACPTSVIMLFTASADQEVQRTATGLGADAVRLKGGQSMDALVDEMEGLLLPRAEGDGDDLVRIRVGPVPAPVARLWVANTAGILRALLGSPREIPATVPPELLAVFGTILDEWAAVADASGDGSFFWSAAASVVTVESLVVAWAALDVLPDDAMARLGCSWSPPEATPFFEALTNGVVQALRRHGELKALAASLPAGWAPAERLPASG